MISAMSCHADQDISHFLFPFRMDSAVALSWVLGQLFVRGEGEGEGKRWGRWRLCLVRTRLRGGHRRPKFSQRWGVPSTVPSTESGPFELVNPDNHKGKRASNTHIRHGQFHPNQLCQKHIVMLLRPLLRRTRITPTLLPLHHHLSRRAISTTPHLNTTTTTHLKMVRLPPPPPFQTTH